MPKIKVQALSRGPTQETFTKISEILQNNKELKRLDPQYQCDFNADKLSGAVKGDQFKANMKVSETDSGSSVEIIIDLPFHLTLIKGIVEKKLQKILDETLT